MELKEYDPKYKDKFIEYNTDWIVDNFGFLEEGDTHTFDTIEEELANGAMIYFAVEGDEVLATCMARKIGEDVWELCKLASNKHRSHEGSDTMVFEACEKWAVSHGAKKIELEGTKNNNDEKKTGRTGSRSRRWMFTKGSRRVSTGRLS